MATLPLPSHVYGGVLVASSDAGLREQIVSTLNTNKWPVLAAHGGADALGKLETSECDVLLLDRQLQDLDCDELVRIIETQYGYPENLAIDTDPDLLRAIGDEWPLARSLNWRQVGAELVSYLADVRKLVSVLFRMPA